MTIVRRLEHPGRRKPVVDAEGISRFMFPAGGTQGRSFRVVAKDEFGVAQILIGGEGGAVGESAVSALNPVCEASGSEPQGAGRIVGGRLELRPDPFRAGGKHATHGPAFLNPI